MGTESVDGFQPHTFSNTELRIHREEPPGSWKAKVFRVLSVPKDFSGHLLLVFVTPGLKQIMEYKALKYFRAVYQRTLNKSRLHICSP